MPILILVGDADGLCFAHAVELLGLLGIGKADGEADSDLQGLPSAQLATPASTTHVGWAPSSHGIMNRTRLLLPIIDGFLAAPTSAAG